MKQNNLSEIKSLLFVVYNVTMDGSKIKLRKSYYVKQLDTEMALDIGSYTKFLSWNKLDASTAGKSEGKPYNYSFVC